MKKQAQVFMLPTEKANEELSFTNGKIMGWVDGAVEEIKHLYLTSDEEIKEGDWYINYANKLAQRTKLGDEFMQNHKTKDSTRKVIATTDKFLGEPQLPLSDAWRDWFKNRLPQIPESFIKAFVESNGTIKEVLVEYELCEILVDIQIRERMKGVETSKLPTAYKLKTRPDNTIIISQSKTYTRDEVEILCNSAYANGMVAQQFIEDLPTPRVRFKQWIKDNL